MFSRISAPRLKIVGTYCVFFLACAAAHAQDGAARCVGVDGALLRETKQGLSLVAPKAMAPAGERVIALFGATLQSPNGAVEARLIADVGHRGPFPVFEAAVRFNTPKASDLDVVLERGILVLTNKKAKGAAHIRLRVRDQAFQIELHEPKSRLGIELYGRHVPGPPNVTDIKEDDPVTSLACFALEGEVVIGAERQTIRLHAPPGNALLLWDSVTNMAEVQRFESLPESVKPMTAKERQLFETVCARVKVWSAKPSELNTALEQATRGADALDRKAAVVALGAIDDLPGLVAAIANKDHGDTREAAIVILRHWLGREPGQSIRLYQHLTTKEGLTTVQAKNFLYMLNGFEAEKLRQPQTYDVLIQALNHSKLPARELAHWHLVRLAPDGKAIPFDAAGPEPQRLEAMAAWRRLIPEGELPPPPKKKAVNP